MVRLHVPRMMMFMVVKVNDYLEEKKNTQDDCDCHLSLMVVKVNNYLEKKTHPRCC